MTWTAPVISVGWIIALLALLLVFIFYFTGQMPMPVASSIALVALARLVP
jgi:hypothetical protein